METLVANELPGSLTVMEPGGHVDIEWTENTIEIDLSPDDGDRANKQERARVLSLVEEAREKGFSGTIDGEPIGDKPKIDKKAAKISLSLEKRVVQEMLSRLVNSEVLSSHLLFRLHDGGKGELIQKSDFTLEGEYQAQAPLTGG